MAANLKSYLDSLAPWAMTGNRKAPASAKKINLALQGGGAHGAFTWGVLDHLLADGRLEITGLSGASAGAVNAVMVADGLARGGPEEARKRLAEFWRAASVGGDLPPVQRAIADRLFSIFPFSTSPMQNWFETMSHYFSPYDFNPLNINPLSELISRFVDFDAIRASDLALYVSATNVHTGRLKVFCRNSIDADVVMASAALPYLFRAVEIDGVPYWDGGYMGNPVIFPFLQATDSEDVLVVQINPVSQEATPKTSAEIVKRLNEITFNSALISELRTMDFVNQLIDDGRLPRGKEHNQYRRLNIHRIDLGAFASSFDGLSKLKNDYDFFESLHDEGVRAATVFLDSHFDDIGERGTLDLAAESGVEWA
ncbi:patatin-like phospholipase family protein [[Pseudomonas] carboxydohydrogena]|uniref:Patatin-like phospholipase family protein n=1 Tax=Afipia carboxydohydrogena TaxID=290 RepID=A0ABY8BPL0_AFICR|nr:patatin-like phospholipase family protein [[Pseudomonas] carboxydohydrogena]WEF51898.1 patatin-like phospholipase family protein [[Pseudomonas] carboxydohydrogena]